MEQTHEIKLTFAKLKDGSCNVFADIFSPGSNGGSFTAKRAEFVPVVKMYEPDAAEKTLLNVPFEELKRFAEEVLKEG